MAQKYLIYMNIISLYTYIIYPYSSSLALGDATTRRRKTGHRTDQTTEAFDMLHFLSSFLETRPAETSLQQPPLLLDVSSLLHSTSPLALTTPLSSTTSEVSELTPFGWDKEKLRPIDYQQNYCPKRCNGSMIVEINQIHKLQCLTFQCFNCDCSRPSCKIYDTCCPDISEPQFEIKATLPSLYDPSSLLFGQTDSIPKSNIGKMKFNNPRHDSKSDTKEVIGVNYTSEVSGTGVENLDMSVTPIVNIHYQQETAKVFCSYNSTNSNFLYVRSCPSDYTDQNMTRMCELDLPSDKVTVASFKRVSDNATNVVYYNQYCARCNGVTQHVPWSIEIECEHFMHVYKATNADEFLRFSLQSDSHCFVEQSSPSYAMTTWCDPYYFREDIIDTCNTSSTWWNYDEDVKRACEGNELSSIKYRVLEMDSHWRIYKNIFCAICYKRSYPRSTSCSGVKLHSNHHQPAFSFLLDIGRPSPEVKQMYKSPFKFNPTCSDVEWPSPNGDCLPFQCSPGKVLEGIECRTGLDFIKGLNYNIRLWLIAESNVSVQPPLPSNTELFTRVNKMLQEKVGDLGPYDFVFGVATIMSSRSSDSLVLPGNNDSLVAEDRFIILYSWLEGYIFARNDIVRSVFEDNLLNRIFNSPFEFEIAEKTYVVFRSSAMCNNFEAYKYCYSLKAINDNIKCLFDSVSGINSFSWPMRIEHFLKVSHILNCSYIRFNSTQYELVTSQSAGHLTSRNMTIVLDLGVTKLNFSDISDFNMLEVDDDDGTLKVCHVLLDQKLWEIEEIHRLVFHNKTNLQPQMESSNLAQYILTLICLSVSMLCLALTLLTYFLFKVLRNMAGIHNMFLCTSLLLAQGSLLAASHLNGPSDLCVTLGISTHFLWLCHFCWSFVCCYHMFKVFTSKTRHSYSTASSRTKQLVKKVALATLVPALIVTFVIIVSYLTSETSEIGYGHIVCYLDYAILVVTTMISPLVLVTLTNITFFIVTVVKIHNVQKLKTTFSFKKDDRQNLYVYIKLSSMTGAFWLVYIIGESLQVDALRFIAILLNGLQGVFIFVSYICNKRVLNLYVLSLGLKSVTSSSERQPKSDRSTLTKVVSGVHLMSGNGEGNEGVQMHSWSTANKMPVASEVHQVSAVDDTN